MQLLDTAGLARDVRRTAHLIHRWQVEGARGDQRVAFTAHEDAVDVEEATGFALYLALDSFGFLEITLQVVSVQVGCNGRRLQF